MNIERMIMMIGRMIMRRVLHRGVDAGIDYASRRGKDREELTPEERKRAQSAKATAKRAKQGARLMRRMR